MHIYTLQRYFLTCSGGCNNWRNVWKNKYLVSCWRKDKPCPMVSLAVPLQKAWKSLCLFCRLMFGLSVIAYA